MKKLARFLAATSLAIGLSTISASAQVANTCTITSTGQGSVNSCTVNNPTTVTIVCTNTVVVNNINQQNAAAGTVTANGNTIAGSLASGSAVNINTFANELALGCGPTPAPTATTTAPTTTSTIAPAAKAPVKVLPKTGNDDIAKDAAIASAAVIAFVGATQVALAAYRRKALQ